MLYNGYGQCPSSWSASFAPSLPLGVSVNCIADDIYALYKLAEPFLVTSVVKKGRYEDAERSVRGLQRTEATADIPTPTEVVALLVETDKLERELTHGVSYLDCFRGTNLRRTEIAVMIWIIQQMCGPVLQTVRGDLLLFIMQSN